MTKRLFFNIIILLFFTSQIQSQIVLRKNFHILDSLVKVESGQIAEEILNKNIKKVKINIPENPASWLVKQHLYTALGEKGISIMTSDDIENVGININIRQLEMQYLLYEEDNDSLIRNAFVNIDGNISNKNKIEIIQSKYLNYKDRISRADVDFIKSDNAFANPPVPEKKNTFFEEIAVPFIVVTTAILTVVILFTVRSG